MELVDEIFGKRAPDLKPLHSPTIGKARFAIKNAMFYTEQMSDQILAKRIRVSLSAALDELSL